MRGLLIGAALAVGLVSTATSARAQALDGPLSAPGAAPAAVAPAQAAKAKPKPHKAHHAKAKPARDPAATQNAAVPRQPQGETPAARVTAPADAFDLGMKWNGNNDGAAQTRFQSGPNATPGAGAEVGMKLHF